MSPILFAILPFFVKWITSFIKRVPSIENTYDGSKRATTIRLVAGILSLLGVVGGYMLTGTMPDASVIGSILEIIGASFAVFIGSTGIFELSKKK